MLVTDSFRNVVLCGDVIEKLRELPDKSIQCVVTSPPYWGLRDYGIDGQIGLEETPELYVQHFVDVFREVRRVLRDDGTVWLNLGDSYYGSSTGQTGQGKYTDGQFDSAKKALEQCDKTRRHDILKPKDMVGIPWRVAFALQEDGWWLRRDIIWAKAVSFCPTYSGSCMPEPVTDRPTSSHEYVFVLTKSGTPTFWIHRDNPHGTRTAPKPDYRYIDQLERTEHADKPDGFDSTIKVNCPSCNGEGKIKTPWFDTVVECTACGGSGSIKRWKRINLWSGEDYFYDQEAVKEPHAPDSLKRYEYGLSASQTKSDQVIGEHKKGGIFNSEKTGDFINPSGRNLRSVWTINPQPYPKAHFATFSSELIEPMIKLGSSERGACPMCGAPLVRVVEKGEPDEEWKARCGADSKGEYSGKSEKWLKQDALGKQTYTGFNARWKAKQQNASDVKRNVLNGLREVTHEWKPSCDCGCEERVPCIVLDPFAGSGTTGEVSRSLGRDYVLIELNPEYVKLIEERLRLNESLGKWL